MISGYKSIVILPFWFLLFLFVECIQIDVFDRGAVADVAVFPGCYVVGYSSVGRGYFR